MIDINTIQLLTWIGKGKQKFVSLIKCKFISAFA